jgi:heptosyltransferase-2
VILTTPLIRSLKNHLPECVIDFLCIPKTSEALMNNPHINELIIWNKHKKSVFEFSRLLQRIHSNSYDIVLCPHRSVRSAIITHYSDAAQRIGFDRNAFSGGLTDEVEYDIHAHEIHRNLSLLKAVDGIDYDENKLSLKPEFYPTEEDISYVENLLSVYKDKSFIGFAPCSQWFTKHFPIEKSVEVIEKLKSIGNNIILFGSNSDVKFCNSLEQKAGKESIINLCGKLSVIQSYTAMNKCKAVITVDSAATHIASATNARIITIFGSTVPTFGFAPLSPDSKTIGVEGLECRPCTDHGRKKCPLGHFKCMYDINIEEVTSYIVS